MGRADRAAGDEWSLEAKDHSARIGGDQLGIGRLALIAASPAQVLRDGKGRSEGPFASAGGNFGGSGSADVGGKSAALPTLRLCRSNPSAEGERLACG